MIPRAKALLDRVRMSAREVRDLSGMSNWVIENTTDPKDTTAQWGFVGHECQIAIVNEDRPKASIKKCSQVGLSEIAVRLTIGLLNVLPNSTAIYTLPTSKFASKFSKARIDPVINNSKTLKPLVPAATNSSELKLIDNSFLYISGSFGQTSAISVPADILIRDEVDFSNQKALSTFASRLGHAEGGGITRDFSTPTVAGYGISAAYDKSSKGRYAVLHDRCGQWVWPQFLEDVIVPGFDNDMKLFESADLENYTYRSDEAFINCPHCRNKITEVNLADPSKRQWIHEYPDKQHAGYQVMPYDVIRVNPISKTLWQMADYERRADWVNFKLGESFEDAETSFMKDMVEKYAVAMAESGMNCIMGMDVGKTSHLLIGKRGGSGKVDVIHAERIKQSGEDYLHTRVMELIKKFGVVKMVVDSMPDFTTAMQLIEANPVGRVFGAYYVKKTKTAFSNTDINDEDSIVNIHRTGSFDKAAKRVNTGAVGICRSGETSEIIKQLGNIKRISTTNNDGEQVNTWVKTGPEHYAHALNYLLIADSLCDHLASTGVTASLPNIAKAKMRQNVKSKSPLAV